ncbi:hypothetical protein BBD42_15850 [Paenibacillus sp. BIHB 4019]|uniref:Uncharacterized protein n=1 Tax=Paenibacillus sp. BIHB 4019 TaxID=1870819 RepID=A0A1B2DJA0_9BACL|nr:hypothetical protein [Paenibacillus sp. BIHB 4019]ANY67776.1 hypothetical protein BBD42_15850 [Paenibacillus sp. BIHB 4019]
MENALIVLVTISIIAVVVFVKVWWDGNGMSWRFIKWYFGIFLILAVAGSTVTFFMSKGLS